LRARRCLRSSGENHDRFAALETAIVVLIVIEIVLGLIRSG
jgi:hypothetical protein